MARAHAGVAAAERAQPQHELAQAEGLTDVVVGAGLEAGHAIGLGRAAGQHEDAHVRRLGGGLELAADLGAGDVGQVQIEQDQLGTLPLRALEGVFSGRRQRRAVAVLAQLRVEQALQLAVILDDEDQRGMGGVAERRSCGAVTA